MSEGKKTVRVEASVEYRVTTTFEVEVPEDFEPDGKETSTHRLIEELATESANDVLRDGNCEVTVEDWFILKPKKK